MEMHCLRTYFACKFCSMASKSRTTNFSELEIFNFFRLRRDFPEVGNKGYDSKALGKEEKAWDEILTKFFNSQNPNGIKSELSQLQGRWRQLNTIQYNSLLPYAPPSTALSPTSFEILSCRSWYSMAFRKSPRLL